MGDYCPECSALAAKGVWEDGTHRYRHNGKHELTIECRPLPHSPTAPPAEGVDNAKWDCGCSYKCSYPSAEMIESARLHLMSHNGTFPHERTDKLLDELEAENKRLREALERILATVHQPNLNDPLKVWHVSAGNGMAFSQAINNAREALK